MALSLVLLAGSGLLLRSLWRTLQEDPGFDAERVAAVTVHPPTSLYPGGDQRRSYFAGLVDALAASPGVVAAGVTSELPLADHGSNGEIDVEGGVTPSLDAEYRLADGGYFEALGIPLLAGFALVALLLAATAFGATWLPARATTTIDPVETLKSE